ncbi:unnamed protein product [Fusarium graminearum]|nr:unnamed protein product [Fusarium graminearum]
MCCSSVGIVNRRDIGRGFRFWSIEKVLGIQDASLPGSIVVGGGAEQREWHWMSGAVLFKAMPLGDR